MSQEIRLELSVRRVENGIIVNHGRKIHVFESDENFRKFMGNIFNVPEGTDKEWKLIIELN